MTGQWRPGPHAASGHPQATPVAGGIGGGPVAEAIARGHQPSPALAEALGLGSGKWAPLTPRNPYGPARREHTDAF